MKRRGRYAPPKGLAAIAPKCWGEEFDFLVFEEPAKPLFTEQGSFAVVEIVGPLTHREGWWGDSYDAVRRRVQAALESKSPKVCLRLDSPGGDYQGVLELSRELRDMAAKAGKELVAFTDGQALSAAYAIACSCSSIVATESASVGSIGVWCPLYDVTAQDAMWGMKVAIVSSGTAKADRNPHVPMTDDSRARLQKDVDAQADLFFELVAGARGLTTAQVKALDGAEVFGRPGLAAGLSDRLVNSWSAFLSEKDAPMPANTAPQASKYDEALGALKRCAEGEDEDAKKAKKLLKAAEDDGMSDDEKKKKEEDEKAAKAAADEEEKKKKDEEAKALAANNLALAHQVQDLTAKEAARTEADAKRAEADKRAAILAKRPDLSPAALSALSYVPTDKLEAEVAKFARVNASPGSAAAATVPGVSGGERLSSMDPIRPLSPEEQKVFDRTNPFARSTIAPRASVVGGELVMPRKILSQSEAAARMAELEKEMAAG